MWKAGRTELLLQWGLAVGRLRPIVFRSLFPLYASSFRPCDPARASRSLRCSGRAGSGLLHSSRKTTAGGQRCGCLSGNGKAALFLLFASSSAVLRGRTVLLFKLISEMAVRPVPRGLSSCNYTKIQLGPNPCSGCQPGLAAGLLPPQCPSSFGHSREPSRCLGGHGCPQPCCLPALPRSLPPAREGIGAGLAQPLPPGVTPQANGPSTSSLSPLVWGFFFPCGRRQNRPPVSMAWDGWVSARQGELQLQSPPRFCLSTRMERPLLLCIGAARQRRHVEPVTCVMMAL